MLLTCPTPMCTHSQWLRNVILWLGESISEEYRSEIALWEYVSMPYSILQYHSHYSIYRSGWCTECWTYHYDYRTECCWSAGRRCGLYSSYRLVPVSLKGNTVTSETFRNLNVYGYNSEFFTRRSKLQSSLARGVFQLESCKAFSRNNIAKVL